MAHLAGEKVIIRLSATASRKLLVGSRREVRGGRRLRRIEEVRRGTAPYIAGHSTDCYSPPPVAGFPVGKTGTEACSTRRVQGKGGVLLPYRGN